jgi:hypothetical protein
MLRASMCTGKFLPVPGQELIMANLIYRVVSACGALGYGFPKSSMDEAMKGRIDAVISDAGSMDAGPYYLGTGTEYFEREAVKQDFRYMVEAGQKIDGPVILGSCGMAGGKRNLEWMIDVAKEVFAEREGRRHRRRPRSGNCHP